MVTVELTFAGRTIGAIGETVRFQQKTFTAQGKDAAEAVNVCVKQLSDYLSKKEYKDEPL